MFYSHLVTPIFPLYKSTTKTQTCNSTPCFGSSFEQFYFSPQPPATAIRDQHENKRPWDWAYIHPLCGSVRFIHFHKNGPKMSDFGPDIPSSCLDCSQENNVWPKKVTTLLFIYYYELQRAGRWKRQAERHWKRQVMWTGGVEEGGRWE